MNHCLDSSMNKPLNKEQKLIVSVSAILEYN